MRYKPALAMSDDCMTYRITVKEYAMKYGWHASFMPKPLQGEKRLGDARPPVALEGRQERLLRPGRPVLPSDVAKAFIAGQLKHAARSRPSSRSGQAPYKRLVPRL
jgi:glutamine synthetase